MSSSPSSSRDGNPLFNLQKALDKCVSDWDKAKADRDKAEADLALVSPTRPKDANPILNTVTTDDMHSSSFSSKHGKSLFNLQKAMDKTVSDWDRAKAATVKFPTAFVTPTRQKNAKPMYPKPPSRQN
ncbi:uncharacterized protein LOC107882611 [Acyrthosiphon pisum]|uniref:Uncharacterized protein n=1 Tax=Acyrthosiphon pisum TaxID=7029 RepID=A0A8R2D1X0_ACYPI|nr:uncharacterized protein LOC107882611 [Acyrthosiphon pisum]|eukprot:XP_016656698.1 PREDICTED: uncharacterized protein LOC107882611 [Acyrthosiphon pisum]